MNKLTDKRPDGWDKPKLTPYLENLWGNTLGTFAQKKEAHRLCRIDDLMSEIGNDWTGMQPSSIAVVPLMMFFRCHSAYRAAAAIGMGGATTEGMAVLRLGLEWSGYSALIAQKPERAEVWWDRDTDIKTKKTMRRSFGHEDILAAIKSYDARLATIYGDLYERLIQFGAHPNEKAVTANLKMNRDTAEMALQQIYLHEGNLQLDQWIRTANQVGICVLKTFGFIHVQRYEQLGIAKRVDGLTNGL